MPLPARVTAARVLGESLGARKGCAASRRPPWAFGLTLCIVSVFDMSMLYMNAERAASRAQACKTWSDDVNES